MLTEVECYPRTKTSHSNDGLEQSTGEVTPVFFFFIVKREHEKEGTREGGGVLGILYNRKTFGPVNRLKSSYNST